jgi:hypothetical protein
VTSIRDGHHNVGILGSGVAMRLFTDVSVAG